MCEFTADSGIRSRRDPTPNLLPQKILCMLTGMKMPMAWEPDGRPNFFSPPAHLCAVSYMNEISSNVT